MVVTASELRQNIYRLLDQVLDSGVPLEIERKGRRLQIVPSDLPNKLDRLIERPGVIVGDPDTFDKVDWLQYWKPGIGDEDED